MKYWTVQTKNVLEILRKEGVYQPDFAKSRYLQRQAQLNVLYQLILESFNVLNGCNLPGLVFAFARTDGQQIYCIETIKEFQDFITSKKAVLNSLWNQLGAEDAAILELDVAADFNPVFIDLNDFQFLMPPVMPLPPYTPESVSRIINDIQHGVITRSEFPSDVIQAHLPNIEIKNVTGCYPLFSLD